MYPNWVLARTWARGMAINAVGLLPPALCRHYGAIPDWWPFTNPVVSLLAGLVIVDLTFYSVHQIQHQNGFLWRWHKPHHAVPLDLIDCRTALHHHWVDHVFGLGLVWGDILIFGMPLYAAFFATSCLLAAAIWAHTNPSWWWLRYVEWVLTTPRSHRMHHTVECEQQNLAVILSIWDRLFRTYRPVDEKPALPVPHF